MGHDRLVLLQLLVLKHVVEPQPAGDPAARALRTMLTGGGRGRGGVGCRSVQGREVLPAALVGSRAPRISQVEIRSRILRKTGRFACSEHWRIQGSG